MKKNKNITVFASPKGYGKIMFEKELKEKEEKKKAIKYLIKTFLFNWLFTDIFINIFNFGKCSFLHNTIISFLSCCIVFITATVYIYFKLNIGDKNEKD